MSSHDQDQYFYQVWQAFASNLGALRIFGQEASSHADQLDHTRIQELANEMADMFGDDPGLVEKELSEFTPSLDELDIFPDPRQDPKVREMIKDFKDSEFKARVQRWSLENPKSAYKFADLFSEYLSHPPINGILIRRSAFVSLMGFLEQLIENLLYGYYFFVVPEETSAVEREEKARRKAHNANSPKDGWQGRIRIFQTLGVDLGVGLKYEDDLLEFGRRRNLIVHKDGVIDDQYIQKVSKGFLPEGAEKGKILVVSTKYLSRAIFIVSLFAFTLTQACWRQWQPRRNTKKADKALDSFIHISLRKGYYDLVVALVEIGKQFQIPRLTSQITRVNQAVALRELDRTQELKTVVSELSREKLVWPVPIGLAILRKDFSKAYRLLLSASQENKLVKLSPYWPLFNPIRDVQWFIQMFEHPNRGNLPKK